MTEVLEHLKHALKDRYAIEREIGSGGMATVCLADAQVDFTSRRRELCDL